MTSIASPAPAADETIDPPEAPRERLAWGFPIGCAIVVAIGFFVPYRFVARPPPPEPVHFTLAVSPFPEDVPWSPEAIARAQPLMDYRWFMPSNNAGHVRMGAPLVSGRLPPEVVRRIVRRSMGRYRTCYQDGLRNNPSLGGRVAARFVIGRDGAVSAVGNGGSDLPDSSVVACFLHAVQGLSFPRPLGGVVTVTYPFQLSP